MSRALLTGFFPLAFFSLAFGFSLTGFSLSFFFIFQLIFSSKAYV